MKNWQMMLEHFAIYPEPKGWDVPRGMVRLTPPQKWDAVQFLLDKGFLREAGYTRGTELHECLYEITAVGRFVWQAGFCEIGRRAPPGGRKPRVVKEPDSLAERVARAGPRTVWELAEKPWVWVKKPEYDRP